MFTHSACLRVSSAYMKLGTPTKENDSSPLSKSFRFNPSFRARLGWLRGQASWMNGWLWYHSSCHLEKPAHCQEMGTPNHMHDRKWRF
ncbi:hypothetical protein AVEN_7145-1 [Araneus ventricosus]|uniref:Uncharacterized protein n=1 Tax=Araneus ventricosus TaxID=182803 RepID=A0A4Y2RU14_ARAVE|nr:hypothetical protein AVEN_241157-1 [Araneus ventricosus]GBN79352.1 hypothetical protein AVEN_7145-1 [Araneus ventricosus]